MSEKWVWIYIGIKDECSADGTLLIMITLCKCSMTVLNIYRNIWIWQLVATFLVKKNHLLSIVSSFTNIKSWAMFLVSSMLVENKMSIIFSTTLTWFSFVCVVLHSFGMNEQSALFHKYVLFIYANKLIICKFDVLSLFSHTSLC